MMTDTPPPTGAAGVAATPMLAWFGIVRLGLVQAALGALVVLTTSTLNRVMVVELALPAMLPGLLVGLHYGVQLARPRFGYGSDLGARRTPWILGGLGLLAVGGVTAAVATAWMTTQLYSGIALAVVAFIAIGFGVGAAGTSLLALLAKRVDAHRRAAAATIVWMMMIAGLAVTASVAGALLDPFSLPRLIAVSSAVSVIAFTLACLAVWRVEPRGPVPRAASHAEAAPVPFREALTEVWREPKARRFTIFVFVSMLAYSAQDLILEPFAGAVFGFTPGQSTQLSGVQHGGVLAGMVLLALLATGVGGPRLGSLRFWAVAGCLGSALALFALTLAAQVGGDWPLRPTVFLLGLANGMFSIAAIASMMSLARVGRESREGLRVGLWGAAQGTAFGLGGFAGTVASDLAHLLLGSSQRAYGAVFALEALLFLVAALLAMRAVEPATLNAGESAAARANGANALGLGRS
jgi:BCD family chlorophyll transporter-like MFS transporter